MILLQLGAFSWTQTTAKDATLLTGYRESHLVRLDSFFAQLWDWLKASEMMTRLFTNGNPHNRYDPHTWTINVEFNCSMLVFLYCICFSKTQTWIRVSFCCILSFCLWHLNAWHENMFLLGILVAEVNHIQAATSAKSDVKTGERPARKVFWWTMFLLSLFVASCPEREPWKVFGYQTLTQIIKMRLFWARAACPAIVFAVSQSPSIQSLFMNRLARVLANLSFSCYLVHYLTIHTVGYAIVPMFWRVFGKDTWWGYETSFVLGTIVVTVVTFWLSDIFWRAVDVPSVRLARWVEDQCRTKSK